MSIAVFALAALHALPIYVVARAFQHSGLTTIAATVMFVVALAVGSGDYAVFDACAVVVAWFLFRGMRPHGL